jgi:hypothetical protein
MTDTTFSKAGMAMPNHPIPRTNDRTTVYRQPPGAVNSPNTPGGEVHRNTISEHGGALRKPSFGDGIGRA